MMVARRRSSKPIRFSGRVALQADGFFIKLRELALRNCSIVALQLLLGAQLNAEVRKLALAALTVLSRAILTLVDRALWTAPKVFTTRRRSSLYLAFARFVIYGSPQAHCVSEPTFLDTGLPADRRL